MGTFPNSPHLLKGAVVGLDPVNPLASIAVFQYSPDTVMRRLEACSIGCDYSNNRMEDAEDGRATN